MSLRVVVEGQGDRDAIPILVAKLREKLDISDLPHIPSGGGGVWVKQLNSDKSRGVRRVEDVCELHRGLGPSALLITQDSEDTCPRDHAPEVAGWIRPLDLPFPVAVVFFYREYETIFLAASKTLRGARLRGMVDRSGLPESAVHLGDPEQPRDAKGWMSERLGRRYVETIDQEAFTRTLDLDDAGLGKLSSYRRLVSGLRYLAAHAASGERGKVYPP